MKQVKIVVLIILFCCGNHLYSQTRSFAPEWSYGVNGGITLSRMNVNSYLSVPQELLQQYSGGIVVRYISEKTFGIQAELNYSQRGWRERTDTIFVNHYARSLTYLELPILTHIYFNLAKHVRLIINMGPQVSYYIGEKEIERKINDRERDNSYYDISVQRPFDYGIKGAMGFEFRTKAGSIILDGRYYFGLSDIFNNSKADLFQASHHQVIGVNLSYLFW